MGGEKRKLEKVRFCKGINIFILIFGCLVDYIKFIKNIYFS